MATTNGTLSCIIIISSVTLLSVHDYHAHKNIWTFSIQNNIISENEIQEFMSIDGQHSLLMILCYLHVMSI